MDDVRRLNERELKTVSGGGELSPTATETGVKCPQCGSARVDCKLSNAEEGAPRRVYRCAICEYLWTK